MIYIYARSVISSVLARGMSSASKLLAALYPRASASKRQRAVSSRNTKEFARGFVAREKGKWLARGATPTLGVARAARSARDQGWV